MSAILIVEDNPDSMRLFTAVLALRGHRITGLPSAEGLSEALHTSPPDLVLLDIQLPGEDGFQALARLRAAGEPLPPVVALTAHAMSGDRERALAAGFDGYLTKPIDVTTFGATVEAFVRADPLRSQGSG